MNKKKVKYVLYFKSVIVIILICFVISLLLKSPSNNRDWNDDQVLLQYGNFDNINPNLIHIKNIRNISYFNTTNFIVSYYNKTFDISKIKKAYFIVEPFAFGDRLAHTFMSFEFEDDNFTSISVEIRKEKGESFSPFKGLIREYEIMYLIGDEKDLVKLRSNYRNDSVYLYPVNTSVENVRSLFVDMIKRTNELKNTPEFYNSITNTCTTALVEHANKLKEEKISKLKIAILFPGFSDKLLYELGLIEVPSSMQNSSIEKLRDYYKINDRAILCNDCNEFEVKIREFE